MFVHVIVMVPISIIITFIVILVVWGLGLTGSHLNGGSQGGLNLDRTISQTLQVGDFGDLLSTSLE